MQTPSAAFNIGANVAKDEIVVACSEESFPVRGCQSARGGPGVSRRSTGRRPHWHGIDYIYHELLANTGHKLGFVVYVMNPKDARHYSKAVGLRGLAP